ncbi:MAG: putative anti-sigma regulatory factor, serine/threonine protein kinase [Acidimicrobiales bacterium]|nr:putative anti-sigma regulatory factor, serine/threonine protein kinase [Acidimicrobiales bacterium]
MRTDHRHAELRLPADPRLLRVARVAVASLAAELPFTLQDIEDLRIAVDELAAAAIDGCGPDSTLDLRFEVDGQELVVTGRVEGAGEPPPMHPVAIDLLGLVAAGHEIGIDGDDRVFRFTKRPPTTGS